VRWDDVFVVSVHQKGQPSPIPIDVMYNAKDKNKVLKL